MPLHFEKKKLSATSSIIIGHGSERNQNDKWTLFSWLTRFTMGSCKNGSTALLIWMQGAEQSGHGREGSVLLRSQI